MKTDRIIGSVLGLALGDAFGAPYEGGVLERAAWALIGKRNGRRRWTDDTQMTIDVIESLVACGGVDQDDLARRFARSYRWSRGYGPGAAKVLKRIRRGQPWEAANSSVYRDGSFGNGGAMRAPAVGLFFSTDGEEELVEAASASAAPQEVAAELGNVIAAIWGAVRGLDALPQSRVEQLEEFDRLHALARSLAEAVRNRSSKRFT